MTRAVALARQIAVHPVGWLRVVVVVACAAALILAGRALPF